MQCRFCGTTLQHSVIDLGFAPPSNALLKTDDLKKPETYYPLRVKVCDNCWLVQTEDFVAAYELFNSEYPYFSSTSKSYLEHAAKHAKNMISTLNLNEDSHVIEIGSNDGYMLRNFKGIPCLGIEPTKATADAAQALGITIWREFFGSGMANYLPKSDLIIGNNVYAHVPDILDFTKGLKNALKPSGTITLEFPHLMKLIEQTQFDTMYHEHFSYLSLQAVMSIFTHAGLRVFDVEELLVHGGSLRIFGCHREDPRPSTDAVKALLIKEAAAGLFKIETYKTFQEHADEIKDDLVDFLITCKRYGRKVFGFGAAAKGNTLLNYAGIKPDLLPLVCDDTPAKHYKAMPGSHVPILPMIHPDYRPDYFLVLPWNFLEEIKSRLADLTALGTKLVIAIPQLEIYDESTNKTTNKFGRANPA